MVSLSRDAGALRIGTLRQHGSAKVILPHCGAETEAVFLNTSGGLTGGDTLTYAVHLGDGVHVTATTQTAERAYKSTSGSARVSVDLTVGRDGCGMGQKRPCVAHRLIHSGVTQPGGGIAQKGRPCGHTPASASLRA